MTLSLEQIASLEACVRSNSNAIALTSNQTILALCQLARWALEDAREQAKKPAKADAMARWAHTAKSVLEFYANEDTYFNISERDPIEDDEGTLARNTLAAFPKEVKT